ncbi:poly [ADP-ribose] polymerase tankyrase-2 [Bicyclus anynana]|uniref:Poly [ADP-ribose] polymerase tankyrase-2 n=1 Tax=Bicyclus anynana TaxID=110368 RepID=A0ABM3LT07_BICAN|nr:poly [ADP-ribose] polymerase tankyrase-2 [Bicyclus anynana]
MDFSSLNPLSSNSLNLAARNNDVQMVKKLLKKKNPNCVDNRGWTCLHEAAAKDSYESLLLILKHEDIRPLAETHEGHTALYLACRYKSSIQTIQALLDSVPDIANYGSTENVTPLHVCSAEGRLEVMQLLIDYGAMCDVQDFSGDTPLHDAADCTQYDAVSFLLHAGANPEIRNESNYTPFHLACNKGCYKTMHRIYPFISDINAVTVNGDSPLILATQGCSDEIVQFLLEKGADPHIRSKVGELALTAALNIGNSSGFKILLAVTDLSKISKNIILTACNPNFFKMEIVESLLRHDLGPEFFDFYEKFHVQLESIGEFRPKYLTNAPINSYLSICEYIHYKAREKFKEFFYLFLIRGVSVDAIDVNECPPLVYIHYCLHANVFEEVLKIFREHGCNVDYCSMLHPYTNYMPFLDKNMYMPDAIFASLTADPTTLPLMLVHSLHCDPEYVLSFANKNDMLGRIPHYVQVQLVSMIGVNHAHLTPLESLVFMPLPLKHLCRQRIRSSLRSSYNNSLKTTNQFYALLDQLIIPRILKNYLRFD